MAFMGELSDIGVADLLYLLALGRRADEPATLRSPLTSSGAALQLSFTVDVLVESLSDIEVAVAPALVRGPASLEEIECRLGIEPTTLRMTITGMRQRGIIVAVDPSPTPVSAR